ncbi:GH92 family glycosyl hydrolase [Fodinibius salsisoli]|uniref:GH92 family glycosyl hydrolase n=1 Tax=Fodinibius salsisoli TaxID=2820877 RepID=A0ABT3PKP7_9BACT|nr:GH92 family glycosyl hydrolase [Fodinibius salsisoli]MCW9706484.1 GH92 family glycosyl hydrolase [Fodinibius salsisoli]
MMNKAFPILSTCYLPLLILLIVAFSCDNKTNDSQKLTSHVNPFIGTEPLTDTTLIGYTPPKGWRVWAGLTYPGAARPNAMVQLSPVTEYGTGTGYQYEDSVIKGFTHTNKGHWNLGHIPVLPVTGEVSGDNLGSAFSHDSETASPGYYRVLLEYYGVDAELTTIKRSGFHRYHFPEDSSKKVAFDLSRSNEGVHGWKVKQVGERAVAGYQDTGYKVYFYARFNQNVERLKEGNKEDPLSMVYLADEGSSKVELQIGLSFVSQENAKENLEAEIGNQGFEEVKQSASKEWEQLLEGIKVTGGTLKEKELFYTSLYRSFLWPALRSDYNGEYRDVEGNVTTAGFNYYTRPALWDTYRNKLVLMGMLSPNVTSDVIQSLIATGDKMGFIPTFFHGDHAAPFIAGSYLRGIKDFDVEKALKLLIQNATREGGPRPYIKEYMDRGYITTPEVNRAHVETKAKAAVTKTLEYAYDDYSVALLAAAVGDTVAEKKFMQRSSNYKNLFDSSTGFMRGKLENGDWVQSFNPEYPYYEYMYREANAWQSSFFAPHDMEGLIDLHGSEEAFEAKMDSLFSIPWNSSYVARNVCCFLGQYSQGNQPDHNYPYLYYFVDKQPKTQKILNTIMHKFYGVGEHGLALSGMDDAGEMSAWYVFNAIGLYPFSPADEEYLISIPLFDSVKIKVENNEFLIEKRREGIKINNLKLNEDTLEKFSLPHQALQAGGKLEIAVN